MLRIRAEVIRAFRDYFDEHGFIGFDAPILTPTACEGTTTLFEVDYFGETAYLTQSGQLYGEAGALAFGKVYCFGPTFRAEKSKTRRHLTEFWMVEPEVAFADLDDDMELAEDFLAHVVGARAGAAPAGAAGAGARRRRARAHPEAVPAHHLRRGHRDAACGQASTSRGATTSAPTTRRRCRSEFDRPVMVHRYPLASKAFYMKADPADPRLALCVDVLAPEGYGEIIGGGQREDDLAVLESRIAEHDLPREAFEWYLDLRRYGSVPHAGFGMGIERTVAWLCGLHHVRETIPFPRMLERLRP